jgi:hypothetical protein
VTDQELVPARADGAVGGDEHEVVGDGLRQRVEVAGSDRREMGLERVAKGVTRRDGTGTARRRTFGCSA